MGEPEPYSPSVWPSCQRVSDDKTRATFTRYVKYAQSSQSGYGSGSSIFSNSGSRFWCGSRKEKNWKLLFFGSKIYISLGLPKGRPSYRRSLQPQKRTSSTSNHENSWLKILDFSILVDNFCPPGSGSSNSNLCGSGSATLLWIYCSSL
jgi:hypothetical protein